MNKNQMEKRHDRIAEQRGDFYFLEFSDGIDSEGLPYKFVYVFNEHGEDISLLVADIFELKTTKRAKFYGALMTSGYGFKFTDIISDYLKTKSSEV